MSRIKEPMRPIYLKVVAGHEAQGGGNLDDVTKDGNNQTTKFGARSTEQLAYMGALIQELKQIAIELQEQRLVLLLDLAHRETADQRPV